MSGVIRVAIVILATVAAPWGIARAQVEADAPPEVPVITAESASEPETAPPIAPARVPRIAVLLLPAGGDVDPAMVDALNELLIAGVAARGEGVQIVGKEELQVQLGQGDVESARCIESDACLGRVGVELGVREIIAGTIATRGATDAEGGQIWAFDLHRVDVRDGEPLGRVFREVRGELDALLRALEESIPELYVRRVQPGRLVVRASVAGAELELDGASIGRFEGAPLRRETVEPGAHVLRARARGHRVFERTIEVEEGATLMIDAVLERAGGWTPSPLVWIGGAVALAGVVSGVGLGVASQAEPSADVSMREAVEEFYPARDAEAAAANVLYGIAGAGVAALAVGIAISGVDDAPREPAASAWAAPAPGGGAMAGVAGRF